MRCKIGRAQVRGVPWRYHTRESALGMALSSEDLSPWATERRRQVVLDSMGLNCDMVLPAVATSKLEMAKFSLTFLTFGEYTVVASTKPIDGDVWVWHASALATISGRNNVGSGRMSFEARMRPTVNWVFPARSFCMGQCSQA